MTLIQIIHRLMGSHEEPFAVINGYDMGAPVDRPGDKDKYGEIPSHGNSLLAQMKRVRQEPVIR